MAKIKRYDDEFKKSLVDLHLAGKTQADLCRDYGVSGSALSKWVRQFSEVKLEDNQSLPQNRFKNFKKRNAQLEEENLILKKASAIFMQNSK